MESHSFTKVAEEFSIVSSSNVYANLMCPLLAFIALNPLPFSPLAIAEQTTANKTWWIVSVVIVISLAWRFYFSEASHLLCS